VRSIAQGRAGQGSVHHRTRMLPLSSINNEANLIPHHEDNPIYIPSLKASVTMGHFVIFCCENDAGINERVVGQILRRDRGSGNNVLICIYLPLFKEDTLPHIASPLILPQPMSHMFRLNVIELVNISKVASVPSAAINSLGFVFFACDVTEYIYHIQGVQDAYLVRFKFSPLSRDLVELNRSTFFAFPDLYEEHNMQWCECLARTIFSSIDDLRIQLWHVLCRFGQSQ